MSATPSASTDTGTGFIDPAAFQELVAQVKALALENQTLKEALGKRSASSTSAGATATATALKSESHAHAFASPHKLPSLTRESQHHHQHSHDHDSDNDNDLNNSITSLTSSSRSTTTLKKVVLSLPANLVLPLTKTKEMVNTWCHAIRREFCLSDLGMYLDHDINTVVNMVQQEYKSADLSSIRIYVKSQSSMCFASLEKAVEKHLRFIRPVMQGIISGSIQVKDMQLDKNGHVVNNVYILWNAVKHSFNINTASNINAALRELTLLSYKQTDHPDKMFNRYYELVDILDACGELPSNRLLCMYLVNALPDSMQSVRTEFNMKTDTLTPDLIRKQLVDIYENETELSRKKGHKSESAYPAQHGSSRKQKSGKHMPLCRQFKANGTCSYGDKCKFSHVSGGGAGSDATDGGDEGGEPSFAAVNYHQDESNTDDTEADNDVEVVNLAHVEAQVASVSEDGVVLANVEQQFILDSGASRHIVNSKKYLTDLRQIKQIAILGIGKSSIYVNTAGTVNFNGFKLNNVLLVPVASANLISVSRCLAGGCKVDFKYAHATVSKDGRPLCMATAKNGVYIVVRGGENAYKNKDDSGVDISRRDIKAEKAKRLLSDQVKANTEAARKQLEAKRKERKAIAGNNGGENTSSSSLSSSSSAVANPAVTAEGQEQKSSGTGGPRVEHAMVAVTVNRQNSDRPVVAVNGLQTVSSKVDGSHTATELVAHQLHCKFGHQHQYPSPNCPTCLLAKAKRAGTGDNRPPETKPTQPLHTLVADVFGPVSGTSPVSGTKQVIPTDQGFVYGLLVKCAATHYSWGALLHRKSDTADQLIAWVKQLGVEFDTTVKVFHSDGGGEFNSSKLLSFFKEHGIKVTSTTAYSPNQNGLAERGVGMQSDMSRAMMLQAGAPLWMWGEAYLFSLYVRNRTPLKMIDNKTPYEKLKQHAPTTDKIHTFGSDAYVTQLANGTRGKLDPKGWLGIYCGVHETKNALRIYNLHLNKMFITRDVRVLDGEFTAIKQMNSKGAINGGAIGESYQRAPMVEIDATAEAVVDGGAVAQPSAGVESAEVTDPTIASMSSTSNVPAVTPATAVAPTVQPSPECEIEFDGVGVMFDDNASVSSVSTESESESSESELDDDSEASPTIVAGGASDVAGSIEATVTSDDLLGASGTVIRRSSRVSRPAARGDGTFDYTRELAHEDRRRAFANALIIMEQQQRATAYANVAVDEDLSRMSYKQAMATPQHKQWLESVNNEMKSLVDLKVYSIVDVPADVKPLPCRFLFKVKFNSDNQPERFKARAVVGGHKQVYGVDFTDSYAPVCMSKSNRNILSIAAHKKMELKQLDFETAFLNAKLDEPIYVYPPDGAPSTPGKCWLLHKALYGLKQAPREWNQEVNSFFNSIGYTPCKADPCVYTKRTNSKTGVIILSLYVDDTILAYDKADEAIWLADKQALSDKYKIKDLGDCDWILNMKITRYADGSISLSQRSYIEKLLIQYNMVGCNPVQHPYINANAAEMAQLEQKSPFLDKAQHRVYREIVGSVLYLANQTRLDIAYIVNMLCRSVAAPREYHWKAAKHLLRYLSATKHYALLFRSDAATFTVGADIDIAKLTNASANEPVATPVTVCTPLVVYCDASHADDEVTRRSTTGLIVRLFGNVVAWSTVKQKTVAHSSTEAEYMACAEAVKEMLWMKQWLSEVLRIDDRVTMLCDSKSCVAMATGNLNHKRTKHIDVRHHIVREQIQDFKTLDLKWISTHVQEADLLTKPMPIPAFTRLRKLLLTYDH